MFCALPPQSVWFPSVPDAHYVFLLSLSARYRARIDGPSDPRSPTVHSLLTPSAPHSPGRKRRVYDGSVSATVVLLFLCLSGSNPRLISVTSFMHPATTPRSSSVHLHHRRKRSGLASQRPSSSPSSPQLVRLSCSALPL